MNFMSHIHGLKIKTYIKGKITETMSMFLQKYWYINANLLIESVTSIGFVSVRTLCYLCVLPAITDMRWPECLIMHDPPTHEVWQYIGVATFVFVNTWKDLSVNTNSYLFPQWKTITRPSVWTCYLQVSVANKIAIERPRQ